MQHNCTFLDNIFRLDYVRGYNWHNTSRKICQTPETVILIFYLQRTFGSELQKMSQISNLTPSSSFASSLSFEDCPQMTTAIDELHQVNSTIRVRQQLVNYLTQKVDMLENYIKEDAKQQLLRIGTVRDSKTTQ